MKRRYKVKLTNLMVTAAFCFLVLSMIVNFAVKVTAADSIGNGSQPAWLDVVVEDGDTLWCLAEQYAPDNDTRKVVYEIREFNSLESADIYPGQIIKIPQ